MDNFLEGINEAYSMLNNLRIFNKPQDENFSRTLKQEFFKRFRLSLKIFSLTVYSLTNNE